ncbi:MAG: SpoIIE family protein phosphatase [Acutalibacteraceae bacterium]
MELIIPILCNTALVVLLYLIDKHSPFGRLPYAAKQIIIGILFGGMAAFASEYGVPINGTVMNIRDAAPISAALVFGAPAGVLSGLIGGVYRWISVLWGAGTYTRLACSLSAVLAGVLAAGLRKFMFDNKKPTWGYGVFISVVCEVLHMIMIFLTNMSDAAHAFEFVKQATLPMVLANAAAVGLSLLAVSLLRREKLRTAKGHEHIAQTFQRWLLICIAAAYLLTSIFTYTLQNSMSQIETQAVIALDLDDICQDITDASDENLLHLAEKLKSDYETNPACDTSSLNALAEEYEVSEINVTDSEGVIIGSTREEFIGYDMADGEQSEQFMPLLDETDTYVQEYGPTSYDSTLYRKYAGVSLTDGGFLQVGYDAEHFQKDIDSRVVTAAKNRHVGYSGCIMICDKNFRIVSSDEQYAGQTLSDLGFRIDSERMAEKSIYSADISGKPYLFGYVFHEGYYIIASMPKEEAMFMRDASFYTSTFMQILIFATLFVFIYFLIKRVIINNLRKINGSLSQITDGNLNVTVDVRTNEEFASLSDDINSTVTTLKQYIAEAAARIDKELEYAKQIQLSALPSKFPPYPDEKRFDIYAQMLAAREVGGDFYDFYMLGTDTVAFLAADVSGKGIPAAMFMMTAKTIIKDLAESGMTAGEIFTKANDKLCENNESGMFVTAWMGILDLNSGKLAYANAGHNPPLVLHNGGEFEYLKTHPGFVLAGFSGMRYRTGETTLLPGDRIFLYTDGVTEATDMQQQLYGETRLIRYINANRSLSASELLRGLKEDIDRFAGKAPQFDDITMLLLDYNGEKPNNSGLTERAFPAQDTALPEVIGFIEDALAKAACPAKATAAICVAIEELFVNIAHYAYGQDGGDVKIGVCFDNADRIATFRISDSGIPFNPLEVPDPDITLSAQERQIGGLGIFIAKKTMDTLSYRYENGCELVR